MEEVHKKIKLTQWGSQILTSILTSQMMVTKNPQNVHRKYFWAILMTFISDVKIDVNICEPHYVNLFFLWTSSIVQMFDYLTFDIFLTEGIGYKGYGQWGTGVWGLWAMGYRVYGPHRQWVTWAMGYWGMGHMGNEAHRGYRVQGYGPHGQ